MERGMGCYRRLEYAIFGKVFLIFLTFYSTSLQKHAEPGRSQ